MLTMESIHHRVDEWNVTAGKRWSTVSKALPPGFLVIRGQAFGHGQGRLGRRTTQAEQFAAEGLSIGSAEVPK